MYRPSQTPRLTLSSEQVAQARPVPPRRETGGPSLGARSVDNSMVRFPLHRSLFTLETYCGCGYGPARKSHSLTRIFKGRQERTGQRKSRTALRSHRPYLGVNPFQGLFLLTEKRKLPGAPIGVSELVCVAALGPEGPISVAGFGTVNPIPFWLQRGISDSQTELHKRARF
ncbi:hypothetical protein HPB49_016023 [Dermacentor silvarum]|uniref:Uncharacterized protein n=1 Tax=Dermacentor silvarum TaxID=543639 RepID=A0ACB8CXZ3_DERSI|nr:hypothetical protein HPB49_016023 [Dermacentor silvarum]